MSLSGIFEGETTAAVSARMRQVRRRDTGPEIRLRKELHRRGLRYRVDAPLAVLPRHRVDVVFPAARVAVFVDGCFWHACPIHGSQPQANATWWAAKFERIKRRDAAVTAKLSAAGWKVVRVWEHESYAPAADRIEALVRERTG